MPRQGSERNHENWVEVLLDASWVRVLEGLTGKGSYQGGSGASYSGEWRRGRIFTKIPRYFYFLFNDRAHRLVYQLNQHSAA